MRFQPCLLCRCCDDNGGCGGGGGGCDDDGDDDDDNDDDNDEAESDRMRAQTRTKSALLDCAFLERWRKSH